MTEKEVFLGVFEGKRGFFAIISKSCRKTKFAHRLLLYIQTWNQKTFGAQFPRKKTLFTPFLSFFRVTFFLTIFRKDIFGIIFSNSDLNSIAFIRFEIRLVFFKL